MSHLLVIGLAEFEVGYWLLILHMWQEAHQQSSEFWLYIYGAHLNVRQDVFQMV